MSLSLYVSALLNYQAGFDMNKAGIIEVSLTFLRKFTNKSREMMKTTLYISGEQRYSFSSYLD